MLNVLGLSNIDSTPFKESTHKAASVVFENREASTLSLAYRMITLAIEACRDSDAGSQNRARETMLKAQQSTIDYEKARAEMRFRRYRNRHTFRTPALCPITTILGHRAGGVKLDVADQRNAPAFSFH